MAATHNAQILRHALLSCSVDRVPRDVRSRLVRIERRHIIAALVFLAGALVYLTRSRDAVIVDWIDRTGAHSIASWLVRERIMIHHSLPLPGWFNGAAADAAYSFALGCVVARASRLVRGCGLLVAVGHEVAQGMDLVPGTFDPADLVVLALTFVLALRLFRAHPAIEPSCKPKES